jgi:hypothetical protein
MRQVATLFIVIALFIVLPATAEEELWIPAAASNPGLHGTMWTTQLWLGSRVVDSPIEVRAAFFPDQVGTADPAEVTIEIQPSSQIEILDAVATLFGENRPGAIRLRSDHPFVAQSRTANDGGGVGSFGQGIPGFKLESTQEALSFIGASNLPGDDGHRTNLGIVNLSDEENRVMITARDGETLDALGTVFVEIGPNGWYQADVFVSLGIEDQTVTLADVAIWAGGADLLGYLSRVDNRSGDGTFIFPSSAVYTRVESRIWELEATLTYTGDATIDRVEYNTGDGLETFDSPESGFSTGILDLDSPTIFCIRALGETGPQSGSIEFEINRRPEDDPIWTRGRHRRSWGAGSSTAQLDEDYCVELN